MRDMNNTPSTKHNFSVAWLYLLGLILVSNVAAAERTTQLRKTVKPHKAKYSFRGEIGWRVHERHLGKSVQETRLTLAVRPRVRGTLDIINPSNGHSTLTLKEESRNPLIRLLNKSNTFRNWALRSEFKISGTTKKNSDQQRQHWKTVSFYRIYFHP